MSLDENNNIYWRGEKLKLETSIPQGVLTFGFWVGVFAILASLSAVGGFTLSAIEFIEQRPRNYGANIQECVTPEPPTKGY